MKDFCFKNLPLLIRTLEPARSAQMKTHKIYLFLFGELSCYPKSYKK